MLDIVAKSKADPVDPPLFASASSSSSFSSFFFFQLSFLLLSFISFRFFFLFSFFSSPFFFVSSFSSSLFSFSCCRVHLVTSSDYRPGHSWTINTFRWEKRGRSECPYRQPKHCGQVVWNSWFTVMLPELSVTSEESDRCLTLMLYR